MTNGTTIHTSLDVKGAILWSDSRLRGMFNDKDGRPMTGKQVRFTLLDVLGEGVLKLPIGEKCEGWSDKTGCPGHPGEEG